MRSREGLRPYRNTSMHRLTGMMYSIAAIAVVATADADTCTVSRTSDTVEVRPDTIQCGSTVDSLPQLDRMVVTASKKRPFTQGINKPTQSFTSEDIVLTAGTAADISRYIATLPSAVSSLGENFDNSLYVRGGRPSEVLFLVDGIEMENINHFSKATGSGGPVGFINSDYAGNVAFFAGDEPSEYPPRLSSVIAVDLRNGSFTDRQSTVGCKLTGGMAATEGPVGKTGSYLVTGRYIDFGTLDYFVNDRGIPRLGDLLVKGTCLLNETDDLSLTGLFSRSTFSINYPVVEQDDVTGRMYMNTSEERQDIVQGGAGITWRSRRSVLSHRVTLSASFRNGCESDSFFNYADSFFMQRYTENPYHEDCDARYRATLQTSSDLRVGGWQVSFGSRIHDERLKLSTGTMRSYTGDYTYCINGVPFSGERYEYPRKRRMLLDEAEAGIFCEVQSDSAPVTLALGTRCDYFGMLHSTGFSPRLQVCTPFFANGKTVLSLSLKHQFPVEMPSLLFYSLSWLQDMADEQAEQQIRNLLQEIQPLRCAQASITFSGFPVRSLEVKGTVFGKWYDREYHFISPRQQEVFTFDENRRLILYPQDGRRKAYGIEGSLAAFRLKRLRGTCSASLFTVRNRYRDGRWYDDWTDVGYSLSAVVNAALGRIHHISLTCQANGGRPWCREEIVNDCLGRKSTMYASGHDYYSERLDRIVSVNVRYGVSPTFGRLETEFFIDVLNVLDAQPILEYRFNGETFQEVKPFGVTPIAGLTLRW